MPAFTQNYLYYYRLLLWIVLCMHGGIIAYLVLWFGLEWRNFIQVKEEEEDDIIILAMRRRGDANCFTRTFYIF